MELCSFLGFNAPVFSIESTLACISYKWDNCSTRTEAAPGEKSLFWVGASKRDLRALPEAVQDHIGIALSVAQFGGRHPSVKPWKGERPGVFEIVSDHRGDTFGAVFTVRFELAIYVLHVFQKKSRQGKKTPQSDIGLISQRLLVAREDYEVRYGKD